MELQFIGGDEEHGGVFVVETTAEGGLVLESHRHDHPHTAGAGEWEGACQRLEDWNEKNPETLFAINMNQIVRRVQ